MTNGKLVNAYVINNNNESSYSGFEIVTCRELSDYEGGTIIEEVKTAEEYLNADEQALDEPFYRVYAIYKPRSHWRTSSESEDLNNTQRRVMADFYNIHEATKFLAELTGNHINIYSH